MVTDSGERLRYKILADSDVSRLYDTFPALRGGYEDYCPTCRKKGYYVWQGKGIECDCQLQLQLHKHYLNAGIYPNYQRLTWDDYQGDSKPKEIVESYLEHHDELVAAGIGLTFTGTYGIGKTLLMTLLVKELVKAGVFCYASTFANMLDMFTSGWTSKDDQQYFFEKMKSTEVLLLDDLGRGFKTKNNLSESTFDNVIRFRMQSEKVTLLTSNMPPPQLEQEYGGALASLMTESNMWSELIGPDYRPSASQRTLKETLAHERRPIV